MKRSIDRILTTHAGSLPRPPDLLATIESAGPRHHQDGPARAARVRRAVGEVVKQQVEQGLDVVDDGEMSKPSFVTCVNEHRGGFEPGAAPGGSPWARSKEAVSFPEFYEASLRQTPNVAARAHRLVCAPGRSLTPGTRTCRRTSRTSGRPWPGWTSRTPSSPPSRPPPSRRPPTGRKLMHPATTGGWRAGARCQRSGARTGPRGEGSGGRPCRTRRAPRRRSDRLAGSGR
jgi:hypothetical protein